MDVLIRYLSPADSTVSTQYLISCFLGNTHAENLLSTFKKTLESISTVNILQVLIDGPDVNLKFMKGFKEELIESDGTHQIIDIANCELHLVNVAFKTGHAKTGWDLVVFLRGSYRLFKCVPAHQAGYIHCTRSAVIRLSFVWYDPLKTAMLFQGHLRLFPT